MVSEASRCSSTISASSCASTVLQLLSRDDHRLVVERDPLRVLRFHLGKATGRRVTARLELLEGSIRLELALVLLAQSFDLTLELAGLLPDFEQLFVALQAVVLRLLFRFSLASNRLLNSRLFDFDLFDLFECALQSPALDPRQSRLSRLPRRASNLSPDLAQPILRLPVLTVDLGQSLPQSVRLGAPRSGSLDSALEAFETTDVELGKGFEASCPLALSQCQL